MAKKVFQEFEVYDLGSKVLIPLPKDERSELELEKEYKGPTAEEIEAESRKKLQEAEAKARKIIEDAEQEAESMVQEAEASSFDYIRKATEKANKVDEDARLVIDKHRAEYEGDFQKKIQKEREVLKKEYEETKEKAHKEGYEEGYESGKREIERLMDRMHTIIEGSIDKRDSIIEDAEIQIVRIVLLIARKVVKAISEEQKGVVIENIKTALEKIKGKTEIIIRVNIEDLELTTEHKDELMQRFEELQHVTILEDTRVDKGGCIIETNFGSVDARIATQLEEIEEKIRELANISYFEGTRTVKAKEPKESEEKKSQEIKE